MKRGHDFHLAVRVRIGISEKDRIAMIVCHVLDSVYNLGDERVGDSGHNDANGLGSSCDQATGDCAGAITLLASDLSNALRGVVTDERAVVKSPRDGGMRHLSNSRNVFD